MTTVQGDGVARLEASLMRRAVDSIGAMIAYWDSSLRCRIANHAYLTWFGVSPEALIGTHIRELLGPIYELNLPYITAALRGEPQEFEREIPDPAGGPLRYSLANYIPDIADGVVLGFFVLVTDISATKRAQLALAESEARLSEIISISADAIITVDSDQRITSFNKGAEAVFGYAQAEIIGRELAILIPDRVRAIHGQHFARFMAAEGQSSRQMGDRALALSGLRKNGEEFPAEAAISKLDVGRGPILAVSLRDITERKRQELEQRVLAEAGAALASSLNLRTTLTGIAELVVRHVADMCIVDMIDNDMEPARLTVAHADPTKAAACEALSRISPPRNHPITRALLEERDVQVFDDITDAFIDEMAVDDDHARVLREIGLRSSMVVPLLSGDSVLGMLVLASSRSHRFGSRDVGFATELARRAALAIDNARLYEAAQRATSVRDDVLSVVAHDVRSPLTTISLAADILLRGPQLDNGHSRKIAAQIVRSVERANRLIEDLLDATRLESGSMRLTRKALYVAPVLDEAIASQRLLAAAASLELVVERPKKLPRIWADRDRLLQIFQNLIGNAVKFTAMGGRVSVGAADRGAEVLFWVTDTGIGIPPKNLPHVFARFWKADRAERRGAGLGLPICKGIVEAHGGRIWAESTVGTGTTFFFSIPVKSASRARGPGAPG